MNAEQLKKMGQAVIRTEIKGLEELLPRIDDAFVTACQHMLSCEGRIVVLGMGKSGHIGGKIAATLASTGSPAFFVHPGEASHGDLGMIKTQDVVLALSNSGETAEITSILPVIKRRGVPLIALTGRPESTLAREADVHISIAVSEEACPLNLAPTASTTATLAMGDALAIALLEERGFTEEDFALSHPGGALGRRLLLHIDDIMHTGNTIPLVHEHAGVREALLEMTAKGLGMTAIVDNDDKLVGIFTDGDLRRALDHEKDLRNLEIDDIMTRNSKTASAGMLAAEALQLMEKHKINGLFVIDDKEKIIGALNMHDLLRAGVV